MRLLDSHAHIFGEFLFPRIDEVIVSAKEAGVEKILGICLDLEEAKRALEYSKDKPFLDIAVGYYPNDLLKFDEKDFRDLESFVTDERIVAIGEIGLDYFSDDVPRELQKECFIRQMQLAEKVNKPIIVHNRLAADDTLKMMQEHCKTGGIMHCYSAGNTYLNSFSELGMYFSFSGNVTFEPDDIATQLAIKEVAMDRILIETDAPNLTPVPKEELENEPAFVSYVADYICTQRGCKKEDLAEAVWKNYHKLIYNIG